MFEDTDGDQVLIVGHPTDVQSIVKIKGRLEMLRMVAWPDFMTTWNPIHGRIGRMPRATTA